MIFKNEDNLIYLVGATHDELGGSIYYDTFNALGASVPKVDTKKAMKIFKALSSATKKGFIESMHDCSEGGLGVTIAEMAFSGGLGATVDLRKVPYKGKVRRDGFHGDSVWEEIIVRTRTTDEQYDDAIGKDILTMINVMCEGLHSVIARRRQTNER